MLKSGDQIGQFILLNHVGSGGFGDVWKAEKRTALDSNYFALKFFRPKDDRIDFDKIGKELAVWKQLKGLPHIISVIELDRFDDYVYVVSDFADGGSLEKWLQDNGKASSQEEAVKITLQLLTGLENLHEKGFVHRDLKPDNILIMNGKYCLADFGISREIKTHSKATGTAGTMEYMPPEAFTKTPSVTPQTDIWAVGVILQKLLTGELPYPQEDYPSLVSAILMYEP
ncbi:MAG: serine/threonine-protein kinase, partial [Pyrinomonadaceae bacterium]|nr:serine/threonine-protein kinase [Pyrinomonadaceae bacterium]